MTTTPKRSVPHSQAPTFGTELSVRPRHFLRGVTLDPHGSETGCGPCPTRWSDTLPRFGIRGDPALFFHDTDRGRRGVTTSTWRKILANLCRSGRGDCAAPRSVLTSPVPCQFLPSWRRASSGVTQPHSLSRL